MSLLRTLRTSTNLFKQTTSMRIGGSQLLKGDMKGVFAVKLSDGKIEGPGDYHKYHYVFDDNPEQIGRYAKPPTDPMADRTLFEWDNYVFEYQGQWWQTGNPFLHLCYIGMLFFFYISLTVSGAQDKRQRLIQCKFDNSTGTNGLLEFNWDNK